MKRFTGLYVLIISFFCARTEAAGEPGRMNVPPVAFRLPRNAPAPEFQAEGVKPTDTAKVFVGYLYGHPRHINFRLYTHLCHAFLVADEEGNVRKDRNVPSRDLTTKAHQAGVKVLLSLGGWGWDKQFAAIVSKPEAEDRYVKSVMAIIKDNDYDGIDLDWEYPDNEKEITGFERLARRFRKATRRDRRRQGPADARDHGRLFQPRHAQLARQGIPAGNHGLDQRDDL